MVGGRGDDRVVDSMNSSDGVAAGDCGDHLVAEERRKIELRSESDDGREERRICSLGESHSSELLLMSLKGFLCRAVKKEEGVSVDLGV